MKAIETVWKGRRFRSRLEARWAVYFESLGRPWVYEPEGYELPSGRYLPDFWLPLEPYQYPGSGYFCEIKHEEPTEREKRLCLELNESTNHKVLMICGQPVAWQFQVYKTVGPDCRGGRRLHRSRWPGKDPEDDGFHFPSNPSFFPLFYTFANSPGGGLYPSCERVNAALMAASTARFEHGEQPRI